MSQRDYYEVLEVSKSVTEVELKKAYRQKALKFHPDKNPGDKQAEDNFKEASEAYEVLKDPEKRQIYDQFGHDGLKGRGFNGFSGFDDIFSQFGDIFGDFFGGRTKTENWRRPALGYPHQFQRSRIWCPKRSRGRET